VALSDATGEALVIVSPRFGNNRHRRHDWVAMKASPSLPLFILEAVLLVTMTLVTALVFDDLGVVLTATGGTASSILAYIAPPLVYLKLRSNARMVHPISSHNPRAFSPTSNGGDGTKRRKYLVANVLDRLGAAWLWPSNGAGLGRMTNEERRRVKACALLMGFGVAVFLHTWFRILGAVTKSVMARWASPW
jgi:hypothetical protein